MAIIDGTNGNNNLLGTADSDQINGLGGNDVINALTRSIALGFDVVDGGAGTDTLIVDASAETQSVQLAYGGSPNFAVFSDSGNFRIDAYSIELIDFTGGSGGDIINSGERGGALNGNGGIDHWLANLTALFADVTFSLGSTNSIAAAGLTSILGMERISLTTGSGDDIITGGALADTISTGNGNDTVNAKSRSPLAGFDVADGGEDTDTLIVNATSETQGVQLAFGGSPTFSVFSDSGNFRVDAYNFERVEFTGGSGSDSINTGTLGGTVNGRTGTDLWIANLAALSTDVTFILGTTVAIAAAGLSSILGIDQINLTTGGGGDTITGGAQADTISTGNGNDTINAKSRPVLGGFDVVDGGAGTDTLIVDASSETAAVQLFSGGSPTYSLFSDSGRFRADAYNIERVMFTGGAGDDSFNTGAGGVTVDGGGGIDHWLVNLGALTAAVEFILGTTAAIVPAGLTAIANIERITMTTGSGNDNIVGGAEADTINTGAGDDTVNAKSRPAGGGFDVVDGGIGTDTLVVNATSETQAVQLFTGGSPTFSIFSGSNNFRVDAYNFEHVMITGGGGDDAFNTGAGGVTVDGRGGIDHWLADYSTMTANITFTLGTTTSIASVGLTSIQRIERLTIITGSGKDTITGGGQADSINTGAGNDTINATSRPTGGGFDVVDGGTGVDSLIVDTSAETADVQLFAGGSPSFGLFSDSGNFRVDAYNMEKIIFTGGSGNDTAGGLAQADTLDMGIGNDQASGGGGADTIAGGGGVDRLQGGRGADTLGGGGGADTFIYASVAESSVKPNEIDTITDFQSGTDKLDLAAIDANVLFADGNQAFTFIGGGAFGNNRGELRSVAGLVEADVNGDGIADFRILLGNGAAATAGDFLL